MVSLIRGFPRALTWSVCPSPWGKHSPRGRGDTEHGDGTDAHSWLSGGKRPNPSTTCHWPGRQKAPGLRPSTRRSAHGLCRGANLGATVLS